MASNVEIVQEDAAPKDYVLKGPIGSAQPGPPPKRGPLARAPIRLANVGGYLVPPIRLANVGGYLVPAGGREASRQAWRQDNGCFSDSRPALRVAKWPSQQPPAKPARRLIEVCPICNVTSASEVQATAAFIANNLRKTGPVPLEADSAAAINQAVKALALARSFLKDEGLDLHVKVVSIIGGENLKAEFLISAVTDAWVRSTISSSESQELFVAAESDTAKVAGSIAKQVRGGGGLFCTACGPSALQCTTRGIYLAEQYLAEGEACQLTFAPEFGKVKDGPSLLHMYIFKGFKECKVGAESDIHHTAGYIAAGVRSGCPPVVLAISAAAINQAVKSLALARSFLEEEGLGVIARPDFPEYNEGKDTTCIRFFLTPDPGRWVRKSVASQWGTELYVASESDPGKVAGAIANYARQETETHCTAMGPQAVLRAMKSIYLAQRFLAVEADSSVRVSFAAQFQSPEQWLSALRLTLLVEWG